MKVFKGKADSWGLAVQYHNCDKSLTFQFLPFYVVFVAHKFWRN
jgi:hypothetical protein